MERRSRRLAGEDSGVEWTKEMLKDPLVTPERPGGSTRRRPASNDAFNVLPRLEQTTNKPSELRYNSSILLKICEADGRSLPWQLLMASCTVVCLGILPLVPAALHQYCGLASTWDIRLDWSQGTLRAIASLLVHAFDITPAQLKLCGAIALAALGALWVLDMLGAQWPVSWNTQDSLCYNDMFCEPTRRGKLVGHLGNTYSNLIYLFGSLCVLTSACTSSGNPFWVADGLFGIMLLILAGCSVVWHASNARRSQYPDLWSMDCCIAYLILRFCALGLLCLLQQRQVPQPERWAAGTCALLFCALILLNARKQLAHSRGQVFDVSFTWSGRGRLCNRDMDVAKCCLFAGMPVLFMLAPILLQVWVFRGIGSALASTAATACLVVGWSTRMGERFVLDGWVPMLWVRRTRSRVLAWHHGPLKQAGEALCYGAAAAVSPTAVLHWFTGATLVLGYAHVRSIQDMVMA